MPCRIVVFDRSRNLDRVTLEMLGQNEMRRSRLPVPLTATIGRRVEHDELVDAVGASRLVTLVGPGGVGKTRLAVNVAGECADRHARGAIMVELARVTEAADTASAIASTLGAPACAR